MQLIDLEGEIELYHVTNVPASNAEPAWTFLTPSFNHDATYDGFMLGLSTVSMTSTRMHGALPSWSPYPLEGIVGVKYRRAIATIRPHNYDAFNLFEKRGKGGVLQRQLLLLRKHDPIEKDFAKVLRGLKFAECNSANLVNEFTETSTIINCNFLQPVKIASFASSSQKRAFGAGNLVQVDEAQGLEQMLSAWIERMSTRRRIRFEIPERFDVRIEPDEREFNAERAAAALIANLDQLYQRCLAVLEDIPNIDMQSISLSKLHKLLRKHGMSPLCLGCLKPFSNKELVTHLTGNTDHIYSLKSLKQERRLVRIKIKEEDTLESHKAKIIFAVKEASLRPIFGYRRRR